MGAGCLMGRKTIEITFEEAQTIEGGLAIKIYSFKWMAEQGLDSQKPIYITPDSLKKIFYIDGWEIEDAKETKD